MSNVSFILVQCLLQRGECTDWAMHWCRTGLEPFLYDNEGSAWWGGKGNLANINFLKLKHTHTHTECTRGGERKGAVTCFLVLLSS